MDNELERLSTNDKSFSRSRFLKFLGITIKNKKTGEVCNGLLTIDDTILHIKDGLLDNYAGTNGEPGPAVEYAGSHFEWWQNGLLHRIGGPAVISEHGDWEEFWIHGELILINTYGIIESPIGCSGRQ